VAESVTVPVTTLPLAGAVTDTTEVSILADADVVEVGVAQTPCCADATDTPTYTELAIGTVCGANGNPIDAVRGEKR